MGCSPAHSTTTRFPTSHDMNRNWQQPTKGVRWADEDQVYEITPNTSPRPAPSAPAQTSWGYGTLLLPSNHVAQHGYSYMVPASVHAPLTLVTRGYMPMIPTISISTSNNWMGSPDRRRTDGTMYGSTVQGVNRPFVPGSPVTALAPPAIHQELQRFSLRWDVRAEEAPPGRFQDFARDPAFVQAVVRLITLRFTTPAGFVFRRGVHETSGRSLRVRDILRAIHEALYAPLQLGDHDMLNAALTARGHRRLQRDGQLCMVDLYPVGRGTPPELYFRGVRWSWTGEELVVHLEAPSRIA
ncbi:hypothetical protein BD309DRAFT_532932 [Dichomitus squalens]|uniref:Uncharacterized protein n=1 Tax=Dichomitus squalens TaxID=114155 RepID=A0A4Q9P3B1_9APHY|nr:hypothetical protein BD309DRAFT_532932 [Dichomitus squalens]TBU60748.1 hypothetical protein BD310DRAFT_265586 [Dichomitus squalens]